MRSGVASAIPARAGISLKPAHYGAILEGMPKVGFFEVHAENYMGAGGPPHRYLQAIRARYPLSVHGVGSSIGSSGPLDRRHLERLKAVVDRYEPGLVSEHLAWSTHEGAFLSDLLPLPYTPETLVQVCAHVDEVQDVLGRQILMENPSTYVRFTESTMAETQFLGQLAQRTGCGLLLDVNNAYVSAVNHGDSALDYLDAFPVTHVRQIHLAGCSECGERSAPLLIDDHGSAVRSEVWSLYDRALERCGAVPSLIEWDNDVPDLTVLLVQAAQADAPLQGRSPAPDRGGSARASQLG